MIHTGYVEGHNNFCEYLSHVQTFTKNVVGIFCGSKDPATNITWCPQCRTTLTQVSDVLYDLRPSVDLFIIQVGMGSVAEWSKKDNPFRLDPALKISSSPTLLNLTDRQYRLNAHQCKSMRKIRQFFNYF